MVAGGVHRHGRVDGLQQAILVDAGEDEAGLVEAFGALGAGADAHRGEGVPHRGEEAALFGQGAAVGDYGGGVHLQAVVVVEAEGLVPYHQRMEFETAALEALARARMAAVEYRHAVFLGDGVDGVEQRQEVLFGVDVLLSVGAQQYVPAFFKAEASVDVAGLDVRQVAVEHFGHGRAGDVGALLGQAAVGKVAAGVLGVAQVDVGDDVDDAAVGLLGQAFVLAPVAGLHVEDGDVQPLGSYGRQARVGVAEDEQGVGLRGYHQFVGAVDDVAHGGAEVVADGVHVHFGLGEPEVFEEDAVEAVVVVLAGVGQDDVEVPAALVDGGREADDFGAGADDDEKLQTAVVGEGNVVKFRIHNASCIIILNFV